MNGNFQQDKQLAYEQGIDLITTCNNYYSQYNIYHAGMNDIISFEACIKTVQYKEIQILVLNNNRYIFIQDNKNTYKIKNEINIASDANNNTHIKHSFPIIHSFICSFNMGSIHSKKHFDINTLPVKIKSKHGHIYHDWQNILSLLSLSFLGMNSETAHLPMKFLIDKKLISKCATCYKGHSILYYALTIIPNSFENKALFIFNLIKDAKLTITPDCLKELYEMKKEMNNTKLLKLINSKIKNLS